MFGYVSDKSTIKMFGMKRGLHLGIKSHNFFSSNFFFWFRFLFSFGFPMLSLSAQRAMEGRDRSILGSSLLPSTVSSCNNSCFFDSKKFIIYDLQHYSFLPFLLSIFSLVKAKWSKCRYQRKTPSASSNLWEISKQTADGENLKASFRFYSS